MSIKLLAHHVPGCPARFLLHYINIGIQFLSKLNMI